MEDNRRETTVPADISPTTGARQWHATVSKVGSSGFRVEWQVMEEPGPSLVEERSRHFRTLHEALGDLRQLAAAEALRAKP